MLTPPPVLGFAAFSGTGKTTLLCKLLPLLKAKNLRVGLIKHSHHSFDVDYPGKDSYQLRQAGASPVLLVSRKRRAIMTEFREEAEPGLDEQLNSLQHENLDLVLVEGFKKTRFAKIELHRPALGTPLLFPEDDSIIAIATDAELPVTARIPVLSLNRPEDILNFVLQFLDRANN